MGWITLKYPTRGQSYAALCQCGNPVAVGGRGNYQGTGKPLAGCDVCKGDGRAPGAVTVRGEAAAPSSYRRAAPVETVADGEAAANLAALHARLDPDQRHCADWRPEHGNVRFVAAAGSGKTTTSVALIGGLIASGVDAGSVIATTFTAKAARELTERLAKVIPATALASLRCGTFHSIALKATRPLRDWRFPYCLDSGKGRAKGIPSATQLWEYTLGEGPIFGTREAGLALPGKIDAKAYAQAADVIRANGHEAGTPGALSAAAACQLPQFARAWEIYESARAQLGAWDFADVLAFYRAALKDGRLRDRVAVILVDEAQDNSFVQLDIARMLGERVILVGDVRQSIYEWRGAYPALFATADVEINATTRELPNNYRSGRKIVALGNAVAAGKSWSLGQEARPARDLDGVIRVAGFEDPQNEAASIAAEIAGATLAGGLPREHAILARTNAQLGVIEAALVAAKVPCVVVGGTSFFARREVQDFLALLSLAAGVGTAEDTVRAVKATRGLGNAVVSGVKARLAEGASPADAISAAVGAISNAKVRAAGQELSGFIQGRASMPIGELSRLVAEFLAPEGSNGNASADDDKPGLAASCAAIASGFPSVAALLAFADKCRNETLTIGEGDDTPEGRVTISTVHRAKGREWGTVYVLASAGVFPHARSSGDPKREAEEERLYYVAVTRAKDQLVLCWSDSDVRGKAAGPSPFLDYVEGWNGPDDNGGGPDGDGKRPAIDLDAEGETMAALYAAEGGESMPVRLTGKPAAACAADAPPPDAPPAAGNGPSAHAETLRLLAHLPERQAYAAEATARTPVPPKGQRYVAVARDDFASLLEPIGFTWTEERGQGVMTRTLAQGVSVKVYTTIPQGESEARGVGEDSIKVALIADYLKPSPAMARVLRPLMKKQPYACRTRGWRETLLTRIAFALAHVGPPCSKCGMVTARRKSGERSFFGCMSYPDCLGTAGDCPPMEET